MKVFGSLWLCAHYCRSLLSGCVKCLLMYQSREPQAAPSCISGNVQFDCVFYKLSSPEKWQWRQCNCIRATSVNWACSMPDTWRCLIIWHLQSTELATWNWKNYREQADTNSLCFVLSFVADLKYQGCYLSVKVFESNNGNFKALRVFENDPSPWTTTTSILRPFFQDNLGKPAPEG